MTELIDRLTRLRKQALSGFRTISRFQEAEILAEAIKELEDRKPGKVTIIDPASVDGQRLIRNSAFEQPVTQGDPPPTRRTKEQK